MQEKPENSQVSTRADKQRGKRRGIHVASEIFGDAESKNINHKKRR